VKHYLFGFDEKEADMRSAAKDMLEFARTIKAIVIRQWACTVRVRGEFIECVCEVYGIFCCDTLGRCALLPKSV
jgi:hypothetical protein